MKESLLNIEQWVNTKLCEIINQERARKGRLRGWDYSGKKRFIRTSENKLRTDNIDIIIYIVCLNC